MRAKILLADGVVVEAEGTPDEIAELTAALGRSPRIAGPERGQPEFAVDSCPQDDQIPPPAPEPGDVSEPEPGAGDVEGYWGEDDGFDWGSSDLEELAIEDVVEPSEPTEGATTRDDGEPPPTGPPLDLVVRDVSGQFRLLGDPTRLRVLTLLIDREHNVGELCEALGGMSQPAVSHHMALLRVSGLVTPSRDGKFQFYDLTDQGRTLTEAVGRFGTPDGTRASKLFRQASDPTRLQVLAILSEGERNVGDLCSDLGGMSQPAVSHHLALLRHGGLIEPRRAGRFSYYFLRDEGRELTRLIAPMMAAKARSFVGPAEDPDGVGAIEPTAIPDDEGDFPAEDDRGLGDDETADSDGAPPAHRLCRRIPLMVRELHHRGYERLRVAPGLSPSGLHWKCSIGPGDRVRRDQGAMTLTGNGLACYSSGQGARFFGWTDAEHDGPAALADKFLARFPEVVGPGRGDDPDYARWYSDMLRATAPDGLIYGYADWELPDDHLPALGCTADVKIALPPVLGATSG